MQPIKIEIFSDVLCVWAYFSEARIAEVRRNFGEKVSIDFRFVSVFGDVAGKMAASWKDKRGYEGFADHVHHSGKMFPEIHLNAKIWREVRPASSLAPQLYLKAIQLCEINQLCPAGTFAKATAKMREAFFLEARDIARLDVQQDVGTAAGVSAEVAHSYLQDGRAHAALATDYKSAETLGINGSPTLVLNQGRQKLYGNVGYHIIEANILELLRDPNPDEASWC
jgi:predicted DsbA family dithiol-disulfide isomerase